MKKPTYNFIFNIGSKVKVTDLKLNGKISGIFIDSSGMITYKVRYFYNTEPKEVYFNDDELDYDLYSGINLLTTYPGVLGLKTGYTPEAGLTLVTLARRGDKEIIGVLLGATNRRDDAKLMLDYSFQII